MSRAGGDPTPRSSGPDPDPTLVGDPPPQPDFATDETLAGDLSPGARASTPPPSSPPDLDRSSLSQRERALQLTRYVLVRRLGAGGMGVVYLAYDPSLDRKVAIKLLRVAPGDGPAQAAHARLVREAQALARLSHGNVVAVHDVGSYDADALTTLRIGPHRTQPAPKDRISQAAGVFLVMEYVPGITLAQWLDERVRGVREVLDVFLAAGRGLVAAHAVGIIHRDFKPGNVLVGETGRICVFDFGLARPAGEVEPATAAAPEARAPIDPLSSSLVSGPLTRAGTLVGTPAYMAPEQRGGAAIDERADQFSFCVALYEGLYGNRPFSGDNLFALEAAKARGQIDPPRRPARVPPAIHRAILRGLSTEPGDRWPSMQALLDALERPLRRDRRRWAVAAGGAALVAGAVAFALAGDAPALCTGAAEALAPTWNPERRAALDAAFAATGLPYAPDAAARAGARVDAWAEAWIAGHTDACAAANIRGEQSHDLLDRRMHCLEDRRHQLDALLGVLTGADADVVAHAHDAVEALPPPSRCADLDALRAEVAPPPPALLDDVQALRDQVSVASAEVSAGHPGAGLALLEAAEQRSRDLGYRPLRAEVLAQLAEQLFVASKYDDGARVYGEAYWEALAAGHDRLAFDTASAFSGRLAQILGHPDDAGPWLRNAEALYERLGRPPRLGGDLEFRRGQIAEARREYTTAIEHYRRSLADLPERSVSAVTTRQNLANVHLSLGQLDPAQAIFEELLALRRDIYGEGHPNNAFSLSDLGNVATLRGDFDTAEKHQRAALTILRAALPPRHERLAYPLSALADIAAQRGDFGAALDAFDEARAIWEHNFGPRSTRVAAMLERLASVQLVRGELGLAEQHATRALVIWSSAQSPDPQGTVLAHLALAQIELARDDYAAARDHTDKALPLSISVLGEDNLYTAVSRAMRAVALAGLGDLSGAEREADAAVASIERNYGAGSLWMSEVLTPRARVRQLQGRFDDARRDLEGSLALLDPRNAPIQRAHAEFQLAQVLWDSRADRAKARTLAVSAQTLFRQAGAKHYRAEIDAWLERHPG
ncbi:Serine/threonine protein kinase [Nannocystis exedens]|uniref:Serine/threonine protein kinase n=2 Tax=Nannocystis exedens TaxID=54 RepID=A0A1I2HX39_9BACT|nr:tetratricopeptide repeat protein [Nannocystis exedens]PCC66387.1 serine/threonine protein kinase [Nannocystis exedens]SFF34705.1 Serine/threonine protein kinase [Nannocystis exedens]